VVAGRVDEGEAVSVRGGPAIRPFADRQQLASGRIELNGNKTAAPRADRDAGDQAVRLRTDAVDAEKALTEPDRVTTRGDALERVGRKPQYGTETPMKTLSGLLALLTTTILVSFVWAEPLPTATASGRKALSRLVVVTMVKGSVSLKRPAT